MQSFCRYKDIYGHGLYIHIIDLAVQKECNNIIVAYRLICLSVNCVNSDSKKKKKNCVNSAYWIQQISTDKIEYNQSSKNTTHLRQILFLSTTPENFFFFLGGGGQAENVPWTHSFNKFQIPKQGSTAPQAHCKRRTQHRGDLRRAKLHQLIKIVHKERDKGMIVHAPGKHDRPRSSMGSNKCVKHAYLRRINIIASYKTSGPARTSWLPAKCCFMWPRKFF